MGRIIFEKKLLKVLIETIYLQKPYLLWQERIILGVRG